MSFRNKDTINKFKKMLLDHLHYTKEQKINAVKIIQNAQRERFTMNNELREALCNPTSAKNDNYIQDIKTQLDKLRGRIDVLQNMYLYYCKFGRRKFNEFIKKIHNCVFLNTSFASTNFNNIKFSLTRFYNILGTHPREKVLLDKLMSVDDNKITIKSTYSNNQLFEFKNTSLINCVFEKCYFHNIEFYNININYEVTFDNLPTHIPGFYKCEFFNTIFDFYITINPLVHIIIKKIDKTNNKIISDNYSPYMLKFMTAMLDLENKETTKYRLNEYFPNIVFEKCIITPRLNYKVFKDKSYCCFKNCTFKNINSESDTINLISFIDCSFELCKFTKCTFGTVTFINCNIINSSFNTCFITNNLNSNQYGIPQFINTNFNTCKFNGSLFHNYFQPNKSCVIYPNCVFNKCTFTAIGVIGFTFNKRQLLIDNTDDLNVIIDKDKLPEMLNMKDNKFQECIFFGTNFSNCDLQGSCFSIVGNQPNYFNWYGYAFLYHNINSPVYGSHKNYMFEDIYRDINLFFDIYAYENMQDSIQGII